MFNIVIKRYYVMGHCILLYILDSMWKSKQHIIHPPCFISWSFPNQKSIINILHRQPQKCQVCGCPTQELPLKRPKRCNYNFGDNDSLKMFTVMSIGRRGWGDGSLSSIIAISFKFSCLMAYTVLMLLPWYIYSSSTQTFYHMFV